MEETQLIIGVDKKNPTFTIYRNKEKKEILVYLGFALMEVILDDKNNPELKLLIARLFNANVNRRILTQQFGCSYHTMERWGEALKSGDQERIYFALLGQGTPRKFTKEIESYVRHRFNSIYAINKRSYSQEIRQELVKVFNVQVSPETLRPIFNQLKEKYLEAKQEKKKLN